MLKQRKPRRDRQRERKHFPMRKFSRCSKIHKPSNKFPLIFNSATHNFLIIFTFPRSLCWRFSVPRLVWIWWRNFSILGGIKKQIKSTKRHETPQELSIKMQIRCFSEKIDEIVMETNAECSFALGRLFPLPRKMSELEGARLWIFVLKGFLRSLIIIN